MNGSNMGSETGLIWLLIGMALIVLLLVSILYNWLVDKWGEGKQGRTALLVAGGVVYTTIFGGLLDYLLCLTGNNWNSIVINAITFTVSGTPMIIGEIVRADHATRQAIERQLRQAEQEGAEL